jgi:hypothetical protein
MGLEIFLQDNVPQALILGLALVGTSYIAGIIFSYVRLLASLFVLSGKSVRFASPLLFQPIRFSVIEREMLIDLSSANMARKAPGQSSPAPPMAWGKNTPFNSHKKALISSLSLAQPLNSRRCLPK